MLSILKDNKQSAMKGNNVGPSEEAFLKRDIKR